MAKKVSLENLLIMRPFGDWGFQQFVDNLTDKGLHYTVMFIENGPEGPYGRYSFPGEWKRFAEKNTELLDEMNFLEAYPLFLEDKENRSIFSICKIWNQLKEKEVDCDLLQPVLLKKYFGERPVEKIPSPAENDFNGKKTTIENFMLAEAILVKALLFERSADVNLETSYYLPIPIFKDGEIERMVYAVYDEAKIKNTEAEKRLKTYTQLICKEE